MKNKIIIFTFVMFFLSALISLLFFSFVIASIIIIKAIPPVIIFAVLTGLFFLLALHYRKCIKYLKEDYIENTITIRKLGNVNQLLSIIFGIIAFFMFVAAMGPFIFIGVFIWIQIYFLCVSLFFIGYTINLILVNKKLLCR